MILHTRILFCTSSRKTELISAMLKLKVGKSREKISLWLIWLITTTDITRIASHRAFQSHLL